MTYYHYTGKKCSHVIVYLCGWLLTYVICTFKSVNAAHSLYINIVTIIKLYGFFSATRFITVHRKILEMCFTLPVLTVL